MLAKAPLLPRPAADIIKCLALGADAVLVGRPLLWALTLGGQRGVEQALEMLRRWAARCVGRRVVAVAKAPLLTFYEVLASGCPACVRAAAAAASWS